MQRSLLVSNPEHEDAFIKVGIDAMINPELTAASYLEKLIIRPKIADLVVLGRGDAEPLDLSVKNKEIIGKKIGISALQTITSSAPSTMMVKLTSPTRILF